MNTDLVRYYDEHARAFKEEIVELLKRVQAKTGCPKNAVALHLGFKNPGTLTSAICYHAGTHKPRKISPHLANKAINGLLDMAEGDMGKGVPRSLKKDLQDLRTALDNVLTVLKRLEV